MTMAQLRHLEIGIDATVYINRSPTPSHTGLLAVAKTLQQISYVCAGSAVRIRVSGVRRISHLCVADSREPQSNEQVTRNAYVPET